MKMQKTANPEYLLPFRNQLKNRAAGRLAFAERAHALEEEFATQSLPVFGGQVRARRIQGVGRDRVVRKEPPPRHGLRNRRPGGDDVEAAE